MKNSYTKPESQSVAGSRFEDDLHRVLAGRGSGLPCAHCHELISAAEIEYEILDPVDQAQPTAQHAALRLHLRCYDSWRAR